PGMTASVEIITDRKEDILMVPLAAVTTRSAKQLENERDKKKEQQDTQESNSPTLTFNNNEDLEVVFLHQEGLAIMTVVKTGISDYENIEIVEGLKENDELVIGPYAVLSKKLKNNDEIVERKEKEEFEQD
ncbi:MAG: efflux transporter periplasmic adaptor subunit, partial [Bacteroidetes bacterium]|nr:efflux transporter periplasmic adaptor subunit [Bacteroidota bacterium]